MTHILDTYHIHINGIVQGTGFRPLIYNIAKQMQLNGYVKNGSDGVHVFINASSKEADLFFKNIIQKAPGKSKIIFSSLNKTTDKIFTDFSIRGDEGNESKKMVLIAPDIAICATCKNELHNEKNRRYRYPFITCTQCGPRYSVIQSIPYERQNTSMDNFKMCENCFDEYEDVADRRFFSQTTSCAECSIGFNIWEKNGNTLSTNAEKMLLNIKKFLNQGKILAIKGIGGYLLLCDACDAATIRQLRTRKQRQFKPFAILYPDIEKVKNDFNLNKAEEELLQSAAAPIVLIYPKPGAVRTLPTEDIAPGLKRLGIMLPYSPLLELIAKDYGRPMIATSGNISGSSIIYKDEDALNYLFNIVDYIIDYDRHIIVPQDDSVVQVSKYTDQQIILRRSRGYAPSFLKYKPQKETTVLATGAFLKSSFTLSVNGNVFVSQFLGSGEFYESQQMYKDTLEHWLKLYSVKPGVIIADKHPNYFAHQYAMELAEYYAADIKFVQHHEAHFAAVLAENNLLHSIIPVLGVVWDGTGLGDDGNIWGGEFFKYENNEMLRCYHFDYFPVIAGDKQALEPRIAALCTTSHSEAQWDKLKDKFTPAEWGIYQTLIATTDLFSSSAGRLFDAVASLLDICDKQTYEGEAAMYLQVLAEQYTEKNGFVMDESYFLGASPYNVSTTYLMDGIIQDIKKGKAKDYIAAKFHYSLVCIIGIVTRNVRVEKICFSGGVFQNSLLVDWIQKEYSNKYQLFFHKDLSPNDENISFGQMIYFDNNIKAAGIKIFDQQEPVIPVS